MAFDRIPVSDWDRRDLARITEGRYYQVPVVVVGEEVLFETKEDPLRVPRTLDRTHFGGALFPEAWSGIHELLVSHIEDELGG